MLCRTLQKFKERCMIEPAINSYLLKSQMPENSKCQFSGLLEGFNKLSSCKKKKKNHCRGQTLSVSGHRLQMRFLQNGSIMCFISWNISPAKKYSPGCTTFSFFFWSFPGPYRWFWSPIRPCLCCLNTYFESSIPVLKPKADILIKVDNQFNSIEQRIPPS